MLAAVTASIGITLHFWVLFLALALLLFAQLAYYKTTPHISGSLRVLLVSLRTCVFLVIVFLLFDPRCVRRSEQTDPANVIALIDRSASMSLPSEGWGADSSASRFQTALQASASLRKDVEARGGVYRELYFCGDELTSPNDSILPDGQGTNIAQSLVTAHDRYQGDNVSALVLLSDGVDTERGLIRRALPPLPVFAVGVGDTASPDDVRIKDVSYSSVIRIPSRSPIGVSLHYSGDRRKQIQLRLLEGGTVVFEKDTVMSAAARDINEDMFIRFPEAGRRHFELEVKVGGYDAEPDNNRRDIVIEAEKAEAKILIVDVKPGWDLHFLTELLRKDKSFDFDVIASDMQLSPPQGRVRSSSRFAALLAKSDALVIISATESLLNENNASAVERFVMEQGGGLLVLPGPSSLFALPEAWRFLDGILPLGGTPPYRFHFQYTGLTPGVQAGTNPITTLLLPLFGQKDWQERSPLLGYYASLVSKGGTEVLLEVRDKNVPAVSYHTAGKGRVAVVSAGPLWRWKFLSDGNTVYDEIMSRLLDVLSRGEETDRFFLTSKRNVFDAGEEPVFIAEVFNEKRQPVTGVPVRLEISKVEEDGEEVPLQRVSMSRESVQSTRFRAALSPLSPGRYLVRGEAELPDRAIASRPVEIEVSNVSVEFRDVRQDHMALAAIAMRSGGFYGQMSELSFLSDKIPLQPRKVDTVTEMSIRTSVIVFILILLLLSIEWIIRKRAGMI
ncbi:MAG: hypothetical protein ABIA59_06455 [Candidatus Latescibacterota bacterium]